ncbi:MAG: hypothetical protein M3237_03430 [Actinomycetota bacterium]|nr:hypothetical protein [Actinomycetota bacterium]
MVILFAVATYLIVRLMQERGLTPPQGPKPKPKPRRSAPPKIVAPDDDEDFLRDLDRRRLNPEDPDSRE